MNNNIPEFAKSSSTFFEDIERKLKMFAGENQTPYFKEGDTLFLEIKVVNPEMGYWLAKWLYGIAGEKYTPFGCELKAIHKENPFKELIQKQLIEFIKSL